MKSRMLLIALVSLMFGSLTANAQTPTVIMDETNFTNGIDNLTFSSARFHARILDAGGWTLNGKGFAISKNPGCVAPYVVRINGNVPTTYAPIPLDYAGSTAADALAPNTTYYVKAYIKKSTPAPADTAWSGVITFTTPAAVVPTMSVDETENIGLMNAALKGQITHIYDPIKTWTKKGFIYSTNPNPVHGAGTTEISITGTSPTNTNTNTPFAMTSNVNGLLSGVTYYVRVFVIVKFGAGDNDTIYSTQRSFSTRSACGSVPYGINATDDVGQTTSLITWHPELGQTTWQVDCGIVGHTPGEGEFLQITNDTFIVADNLTSGVDYTAYIRAVCGDTIFSEWSVLNPFAYFQTLPYTCAPIAYIEATQVLATSAVIIWTPGATTQWWWEVMFAPASEDYPQTGEMVKFTPTFNPIGLTLGTTYKVKVRAICDKHDDIIDTVGEWSDEITFTPSNNGLSSISQSQNLVKVYPNPTTGEINFYSDGIKIDRIEIIDCLGNTVASLKEDVTSFTFGKGITGLFVIKIYTNQGLQIEKIIVE